MYFDISVNKMLGNIQSLEEMRTSYKVALSLSLYLSISLLLTFITRAVFKNLVVLYVL